MYLVLLIFLQRCQLPIAMSLDVRIRQSTSSLNPVLLNLLEFIEQLQELELQYLDEATAIPKKAESTLTQTIESNPVRTAEGNTNWISSFAESVSTTRRTAIQTAIVSRRLW